MNGALEHDEADAEPKATDPLTIDLDYMHALLVSLGVDISHEVAPSFALGAFDVMAVMELGAALPDSADFRATFDLFATLRDPQPQEVRDVQLVVLQAARRCIHLDNDRIKDLEAKLHQTH